MNPLQVKALAAIQALTFSVELGFQEIEIEGAALGVIKKIQSSSTDLSPIGPVIDEMRFRARSFRSCLFKHTLRKGNEAAHVLAKQGLGFNGTVY
ncbi:hypothetical protein REPUB_Repub17cG0087400 [Reevesia pubescens]